jgi:hypothetical protein
LHGIS